MDHPDTSVVLVVTIYMTPRQGLGNLVDDSNNRHDMKMLKSIALIHGWFL